MPIWAVSMIPLVPSPPECWPYLLDPDPYVMAFALGGRLTSKYLIGIFTAAPPWRSGYCWLGRLRASLSTCTHSGGGVYLSQAVLDVSRNISYHHLESSEVLCGA